MPLTKGHYRFPMITASPKPVTRYCPLVHAGARTILGEQIVKALDLTRRCTGLTGSAAIPVYNVAVGSFADKPSPAKIDGCPLLSESGQTRVRLDCPLSAIRGLGGGWIKAGRVPD